MNYVKLVNFEVQRFFKLFSVVALIIALMQIGGAIYRASTFETYAETIMRQQQIDLATFLQQYGPLTLPQFLTSSIVELSIMLGIVVIVIYTFFIWYRDWLGKSSFIYRLLMLPSTRLHIFTAKLTTILLFVLGLISLQRILITINDVIMYNVLPAPLYERENIAYVYSHDVLAILMPHTWVEGLFIYGFGIAAVTVIFTAILCERSFGLIGIVAGIVYSVAMLVVLLSPTMIPALTMMLYPHEQYMCLIAVAVLVALVSSTISYYLLTRKMTV